jgi:hypothetical protein
MVVSTVKKGGARQNITDWLTIRHDIDTAGARSHPTMLAWIESMFESAFLRGRALFHPGYNSGQ